MLVWLNKTDPPASMTADSDGGELHGFTWKSEANSGPVKLFSMLQRKRVQHCGGEVQNSEP